LDEIVERIGIPMSETIEIIDFLAAHNFVEIGKNEERAKVSKG
jgi:DNA-binding IclR family transcriptional regulator